MSTPLIVTQLLLKKAEIEVQIESLNARLTQAKADLLHLGAVVKLFDPTAVSGPATAYHGVAKAMKREDLFDLCKAALEASPEPLCTRQLARHVITAEGWDADDGRLRLSVVHKVGTLMTRFAQRGLVQKVGERERAGLWRLARGSG